MGDPLFPTYGNGGYDVQHYDIDLTVSITPTHVSGQVEIQAAATQPLDAFNLDFYGMELSSLAVDGAEADFCFDRELGEVTVRPEEPLSADQLFTISATFAGEPTLRESTYGFYSGWYTVDGAAFSVPTPDNPAFLYPNNEYNTDRATYRIRINAPAGYQAITNGILKETKHGEAVTTSMWEEQTPVSGGLLFSIDRYPISKTMAGPGGLLIQVQFPEGVPDYDQVKFDILPELLEFYTGVFGPYPYDTLGVTWVRNFPVYGASFSSRIFVFTDELHLNELIPHETAHSWYGSSILPASVRDTWLSEGFATYAALLWIEHQGKSIDDEVRHIYEAMPLKTGLTANPAPDELNPGSQAVYRRGALTLHALRKRVGDKAFFDILRAYTDRYQSSMASTQDFIAVAKEVSGQDLGEFFQGWLYDERVPDLPELGLSK